MLYYKTMNMLPLAMACALFLTALSAQAETRVTAENDWVTLSNKQNTLSFNLKNGLYYILDAKGTKLIDYAYFKLGGLQSKEPDAVRTHSVSDVKDKLGSGKCLTIKAAFDNDVDVLWQVTMYEETPYIVFNMGLNNDTPSDYRLTTFNPLITKRAYSGEVNTENYKVVDGNGGGASTLVTDKAGKESFNNLLFRFGSNEAPRIFVAGGLTYKEFEKFVGVNRGDKNMTIDVYAEDPIGKGIPAGQSYLPDERFYVCLNNEDPFQALEKYGQTLKTAQNIKLNYYDFPTECLWYASFYNRAKGRLKFNDSKGAVDEMDNAIKSGITKYTRVAIRLVPDAYGADNQQGWWDDEHWAKYGDAMSTEGPHYIAPYLTTQSWAEAIRKKGGIPLTYFQGTRRSEDYARQHPDHMLFNTARKAIAQPDRFCQKVELSPEYGTGAGYYGHWWTDQMRWSYDLTDPGFVKHMQEVYKNLKDGGIAGLMYDYPDVTGWAFEGGFEDKNATTAFAYRNTYKLAYEGLGEDCYIHERNLLRGSDLTLGLVASQRVWADTDNITPEMITRCGLRWYKNRVVVSYDMDAKDPVDVAPKENRDGNRTMLTMCYVTSGRFLMGRGFDMLNKDEMYDLTRCFPYHTTPQSARPLDAFHSRDSFCRVYDFAVTPEWHQLTFYNPDIQKEDTLSVSLNSSLNAGGMALNPDEEYLVYDFWNNTFVGSFKGSDTLKQTLRPGESRMLSVRKKQNVPQYLSTNRHLMQGYLDMKACDWNAEKKALQGRSQVVEGEPYEVIIAGNGLTPDKATSPQGQADIQPLAGAQGLYKLTLSAPKGGEVSWNLRFK